MTQQELKNLPIEKLRRGRYQPRQHFDEEALRELADSIKEQGIIEPIVVRPVEQDDYEIIAGERRWRAAQLAGLDHVFCIVRPCSDDQAAELTIIENIQREDLNPIEEASGYQRLLDDFGYIHEEVAAAVGKSRTKISNMLRLLSLDDRVQQLMREGQLREAHGKILASIAPADQITLAHKIIKHHWSVRRLEKEIKQLTATALLASDNDPDVAHLERDLTDYFGSKVNICYDENGRGQLSVDFTNYEIFEGLLHRIGYLNK